MSQFLRYYGTRHDTTTDVKVKKAIRERVSYYKKSGFCIQVALRKAIQKSLPLAKFSNSSEQHGVGKTNYLLPQIQNLVPQKRGRKRNSKIQPKHPGKFKTAAAQGFDNSWPIISDPTEHLPNIEKVQEPTSEQIQAEITKLKAQGIFTETKLSFFAENVIPFPVKTSSQPVKISWTAPEQVILSETICSRETVPATALDPTPSAKSNEDEHGFLALQIMGSIIVVALASGLLMYSSAAAFGEGWIAYLKAALLEVAIISLSIWKTTNVWSRVLTRFLAFAAITLSLLVLHAGVQKNEDLTLSALSAKSEDVEMLRKQFASAIASHDQLDPSWVSKRQAAMEKAEEIRLKIKEAELKIQQGSSANTVHQLHLAESGLRALLLILNILFSHHLMSLAQRKNGS